MSANRSEVVGVTLAVASLTEEAGALLQQLLAAHPGEQLGLALRMPAEGPIDWSSLVLWMIATGTVTAGALWAGQGVLRPQARRRRAAAQHHHQQPRGSRLCGNGIHHAGRPVFLPVQMAGLHLGE
jgi:hypothetical protein